MRIDTFARPNAILACRLERNDKGRDVVVGDVHGHFSTFRKALDELEVGEHDRVISLGNLVDHGPDSWAARDWITGPDPVTRFALTLRGEHEQRMLEALLYRPPDHPLIWENDPRSLWIMGGGDWWESRKPGHGAQSWVEVLRDLPFCARVETRFGAIGLVHACPVHERWRDLEEQLIGDGEASHVTRAGALRGHVRHGYVEHEIGETEQRYLGPVKGVRCVVTGHTPLPKPRWHENVLGIHTGVHIDDPEYRRLTIARIDSREIETWSFVR